MPIYEYHCLKCGAEFERSEHIEQHEKVRPRCPKCKSSRVEQVYTSFFAKTAKKS